MTTVSKLKEQKIIAICRGIYGDTLCSLASALVKGGVGAIEVTFDQADPDAARKCTEAIELLAERFGGSILPGAGTVLTPQQVEIAASAGARYIISPNTDAAVIAKTRALGLVSIPGAMTPTEIMTAWNAGADMVKLFPAGYLGISYIKDILAPISHVPLVATGGVNEKNLADYLALGFAGAGISSRFCDKALLARGDFDTITRRAEEITAIARQY